MEEHQPAQAPTTTPVVWSDPSILKSIKNPSDEGYEISIKSPEVTFLGVKNQPDFGKLFLTMYPGERVVELRSFKLYLQQFRQKIVSYERLANVIFKDIMEVYKPVRLRLLLRLKPRGGISSKLVIDSDWAIRGGREQFKDWVGQPEEW